MMRSLIALHLAAAASLLCVTSVAQSRFCTGGDLGHLSQAEKAQCAAKLQLLRRAATQLNTPDDWHYVLVCGEEGWKQYSAYASGNEAGLSAATADTNIAAHETFVRESRLDLGDVAAMRALISHSISEASAGGSEEAATAQPKGRSVQAPALSGAL